MRKRCERSAKRWGLPAIGLAVSACVGCCALPVLAAGSIVGGGLVVPHDSCLAPIAVLLLVVGVAASAVWIRRIRTDGTCGDGVGCGCASDSAPETLQANMFGPQP